MGHIKDIFSVISYFGFYTGQINFFLSELQAVSKLIAIFGIYRNYVIYASVDAINHDVNENTITVNSLHNEHSP